MPWEVNPMYGLNVCFSLVSFHSSSLWTLYSKHDSAQKLWLNYMFLCPWNQHRSPCCWAGKDFPNIHHRTLQPLRCAKVQSSNTGPGTRELCFLAAFTVSEQPPAGLGCPTHKGPWLLNNPVMRSRLPGCVSFLGLPVQIATNRVAKNSRNLFSHGSGGQKSEIKASAGLVPFGSSERICLLSLSQLLVASGSPWPSLACGSITLISVSIFLWLCVCVSVCLYESVCVCVCVSVCVSVCIFSSCRDTRI